MRTAETTEMHFCLPPEYLQPYLEDKRWEVSSLVFKPVFVVVWQCWCHMSALFSVYILYYLFSMTFQSVVKLLTPFSQLTKKSLKGTTFILCWDDLDSCWWPPMKGLLSYCHWPDPCSCSFLRHLHGYTRVLWVEGDAVSAEQLEGKNTEGVLIFCGA